MNRTLVAALALCLLSAHAQAADWFTLTGDLADTQVDTAQLDMSSVGQTTLRFRVSLARPRTLEGEVYQSYVSNITVDCASGSVFHDEQQRFADALWRHELRVEVFTGPKPMAFLGLLPDPRPRLLVAACRARQR